MPRKLIAPLDVAGVKDHAERLHAMAWAVERLAVAMQASGMEVVQFDYIRGMLAGLQACVGFVEYGERQLEEYLHRSIEDILASPRPAAAAGIQRINAADPDIPKKWEALKAGVKALKIAQRKHAAQERFFEDVELWLEKSQKESREVFAELDPEMYKILCEQAATKKERAIAREKKNEKRQKKKPAS